MLTVCPFVSQLFGSWDAFFFYSDNMTSWLGFGPTYKVHLAHLGLKTRCTRHIHGVCPPSTLPSPSTLCVSALK